ncbi:S49 family peptidase, partial [Halorubrum sp. E3]
AIAHADAYLGTEAVENGFADRFGFVDGAVADAAAEAGIDDYAVDTRRTENRVPRSIPLLQQADGTVVVDEPEGELNDDLILAVAPETWDETVGEEVVMTSYTGRLPADHTASETGVNDTKLQHDETASKSGGETA